MSVPITPTTHRYQGSFSSITFSLEGPNGLSATICTPRTCLRSVTMGDEEDCARLYGNKNVMEKFATGQTLTQERVQALLSRFVSSWSCNDPYAPMTIFRREQGEIKEFLGLVCLFHSGVPGKADLFGLGDEGFWRRGYGTEVAQAMVWDYAPATVQEGYLLEGKPLEEIEATARPDNGGSCAIIEKVGLQFSHVAERFGAERQFYSIGMEKILEKFRSRVQ